MAEEKPRIAILLHGHQCAGKTTAAKRLWGMDPIILDDDHPPYEKRLRREEDLIVLELGCGEFRADSRPGPTRNPGEWLRVLKDENRVLFAFLLNADLPTVEVRARAEEYRGVNEASMRISHELYRTYHEAVTLPANARISEYPINTTDLKREEVEAEIRRVVNEEPPSWHPT